MGQGEDQRTDRILMEGRGWIFKQENAKNLGAKSKAAQSGVSVKECFHYVRLESPFLESREIRPECHVEAILRKFRIQATVWSWNFIL